MPSASLPRLLQSVWFITAGSVIRLLGGVTRREARRRHDDLVAAIHQHREAILEMQELVRDSVRRTDDAAACVRYLNQSVTETSEWLCQLSQSLPVDGVVSSSREGMVSVIMPVMNRASVVASAIESVLAQTWPHWELLIVDDGSQDDTAAVVAPYLNDARIRWLTRPHQGVCAARNFGLSQSSGSLIAYLDSDNTWYPGHLAATAGYLLQHPETHCVFTAQLVHNATQQTAWVRGRTFEPSFFAEHGGIDLNAFVHRRRICEQLGGFDQSLTRLVDWDLIGRYARIAPPVLIPNITVRYHEARPDSISVREDYAGNEAIVRARQQESESSTQIQPPAAADHPGARAA